MYTRPSHNSLKKRQAVGIGLVTVCALTILSACGSSEDASSKGGNTYISPVVVAADARLRNAAQDPDNWLTHGGTYSEQRFSPLDQINTGNVAELGLAWSADFDVGRAQESTPLVVDGVLYTTTSWSKVRAYDAATGKQLWFYDPKVPGTRGLAACCDVPNRGAAYYDGKIFFGTLDGRLIALNAKTGQPVWSEVTVDQTKPYTITGAPRVANGLVLIGNGGAEYGVRGYVTAYDAQTGKKVWRFYTVPNSAGAKDGEVSDDILASKANSTWSDGAWKTTGGGGTVWDAIVYDQKYDRVYIGVGNGSPWNHKLRSNGKGDNLFLSSIVALDAKTGKYLWHYQETPGENWDFTATQPITLATLSINGKSTDVLMHAPKNGFFYVLDRNQGRLLSAKPLIKLNWATGVDLATGRPIETASARKSDGSVVMPGGMGAHNWHPMAYSPLTKLIYIPVQEVGFPYGANAQLGYRAGLWNTGFDWTKLIGPNDAGAMKAMRATMKGQLIAWDPVAQKEVWRLNHGEPWNGGVLATGGGLLFQGTTKSRFNAIDAVSGKILWSFLAQNAAMAGPISYRVGGEQYIAVVAGAGGTYNLYGGDPENPRFPVGRILVFKLGGKAALPKYEAPKLPSANPAQDIFSAAQIAEGRELYAPVCSVCHGGMAQGNGILPDLRRSGALANSEAWKGVLIDGILADGGMVSFKKYFSPQQAEALRAYVSSQAELLKKQERSTK